MIIFSSIFNGESWSEVLPLNLDSERTLILISAKASVEIQNVVQDLEKNFPRSIISGCSSAGSVSDCQIFDSEIILNLIKFESSNLRSVSIEISKHSDSFEVGREVANRLKDEGLRHILVLSEGLKINGTQLVRGITQTVRDTTPNVTVSGGLSADGTDFKVSWTIQDGVYMSGRVVAIGFYGKNLRVGLGSSGGWERFGPERKITKSHENFLEEIDHQPALELYKSYLGKDLSKSLPGSAILFPIALSSPHQPDLVRTVLSIDEISKTMTFAGDMPNNSSAYIMRPRFDRLLRASGDAGKTAAQSIDSKLPSLCIAVSCVGRRMVLGEKCEDELESLKNQLPKNCLIFGFYSNGEINYLEEGHCQLLNQTMSVTLMQEF